MKTITYTLMMAGAILISSCTKSNDQGDVTGTTGTTIVKTQTNSLTDYLELKNALSGSEADGAKIAAEILVESLTEENKGATIIDAASSIASSNDTEEQLESFQNLTNLFIASLKENGVGQKVYVQYCPMAFDNSGGTWLSLSEKIENPYFGGEMLYCGSVQEILE